MYSIPNQWKISGPLPGIRCSEAYEDQESHGTCQNHQGRFLKLMCNLYIKNIAAEGDYQQWNGTFFNNIFWILNPSSGLKTILRQKKISFYFYKFSLFLFFLCIFIDFIFSVEIGMVICEFFFINIFSCFLLSLDLDIDLISEVNC